MKKEAILTAEKLNLFFKLFQSFYKVRFEEALKNKNIFQRFFLRKIAEKKSLILALLDINEAIRKEINTENGNYENAIKEFSYFVCEKNPEIKSLDKSEIKQEINNFIPLD